MADDSRGGVRDGERWGGTGSQSKKLKDYDLQLKTRGREGKLEVM